GRERRPTLPARCTRDEKAGTRQIDPQWFWQRRSKRVSAVRALSMAPNNLSGPVMAMFGQQSADLSTNESLLILARVVLHPPAPPGLLLCPLTTFCGRTKPSSF